MALSERGWRPPWRPSCTSSRTPYSAFVVKIIGPLILPTRSEFPWVGSSPMGRMLDPSTLGDHIDRLYRAACALTGNRPAADDLVQETYARVLAKPRRITAGDDVGYLVRTMRNVFLDQRRQAVRRATDAVDPEAFDRVESTGTAGPQAAAEQRELLGFISDLPEEFRDV